jgi:hypothetical protein
MKVTSFILIVIESLLTLLLPFVRNPTKIPITMAQVATQGDPLRAKSYQFWRKEFLPLLQQDCLGDNLAAIEANSEDATSIACEQRQAAIYATASALEAIKWGCPGGIATLLDTGTSSVYCLDDNTILDSTAYRQVERIPCPYTN